MNNKKNKVTGSIKLWIATMLATCFFTKVYSQNITTQALAWKVSSTMIMRTGETEWNEDLIISYGSDSVTWTASTGEARMSFEVDKLIGKWDNADSNGSLTMSFKDGIGNITFEKTGGRLGIRLIVLTTDEPEIYEFEINSVNPI